MGYKGTVSLTKQQKKRSVNTSGLKNAPQMEAIAGVMAHCSATSRNMSRHKKGKDWGGDAVWQTNSASLMMAVNVEA